METIFWTGLILLAAILGTCASILGLVDREVARRSQALLNTLWTRRNKIPLLLESLTRANVRVDSREEIIQTRSKLMSPLGLKDMLEQEKHLSGLLDALFRKYEDDAQIASEILFFVLKKEFLIDVQSIRVAINDYNFSLAKFRHYTKMPWFKIFQFMFESRNFEPLQTV